jgi:hypothetical protein
VKVLGLVAVLLSGCTPLAAYSHSFGYMKEMFGKDMQAEAQARLAELKRREAGYTVERQGVFPHRNATPRDDR